MHEAESAVPVKVVVAGRGQREHVRRAEAERAEIDLVLARAGSELADALIDAEGVYIHSLTPEQFRAAKKLRWIQSQGAGVDWVADVQELIESDVVLTNARGAHAGTVAEHAF